MERDEGAAMIDVGQFRVEIVKPTLEHLGMWSPAAENLIVGTAIQESHLTYLRQIGGGAALGVMQMEPATHNDIWENYIAFRDALESKVIGFLSPYSAPVKQLVGNLPYAVAMARVHYWRDPDPLPGADDIMGLGEQYKRVYNTHLGAATASEFVLNYNRFASDGKNKSGR